MQLTPQQRLFVRKRTTVHDPDPSELSGELNIVPFLDIVVNVIMFLLATTQAVLAVAQLDAQLPSLGRRVGRTQLDSGSTLNLSVNITRAGLIVFASGGKLAPGCGETQSGRVITVPATNGRLVWARRAQGQRSEAGPTAIALTECVRRVKAEFHDETQVILSADPEIEFEHVVGAMDALRGPGPDPLFPDVLLSAGQR
jgi:biopolymer transport protein TolR